MRRPEMEVSKQIKQKREDLNLTVKELSDAIGLGRNGDKIFRQWESGTEIPTKQQLNRILNFATNTPYMQEKKRG